MSCSRRMILFETQFQPTWCELPLDDAVPIFCEQMRRSEGAEGDLASGSLEVGAVNSPRAANSTAQVLRTPHCSKYVPFSGAGFPYLG